MKVGITHSKKIFNLHKEFSAFIKGKSGFFLFLPQQPIV